MHSQLPPFQMFSPQNDFDWKYFTVKYCIHYLLVICLHVQASWKEDPLLIELSLNLEVHSLLFHKCCQANFNLMTYSELTRTELFIFTCKNISIFSFPREFRFSEKNMIFFSLIGKGCTTQGIIWTPKLF